jgi:hypothetical protein
MALAMRGNADAKALIEYVKSHKVPDAWREGPLKITLGGPVALPDSRQTMNDEKAD